jgi:membrane-associated phospholipid phosphatase
VTPAGITVFNAISLIGAPAVVGTFGVVVAAVLFVRRRRLLLLAWVAALGGASLLDWALKRAIHRPRPSYSLAYLHGESFSFPSGHAMGSLVTYGMFAYLLITFWTNEHRKRIVILSFTSAMVLAIGISRLYLGVHYFSDVVGGFAAGLVWLAACISGVEMARRRVGLSQRANSITTE